MAEAKTSNKDISDNDTAKSQTAADSLYEDKFCRVTKENIIIKCYYFPVGQKKTVRLDSIKVLSYEPQLKSSILGTKGWGMGLSTVWWAKDIWRQLSGQWTNVVLTVERSTIEKGFSVERFNDFLSVILPLLKSEVKIIDKIP